MIFQSDGRYWIGTNTLYNILGGRHWKRGDRFVFENVEYRIDQSFVHYTYVTPMHQIYSQEDGKA